MTNKAQTPAEAILAEYAEAFGTDGSIYELEGLIEIMLTSIEIRIIWNCNIFNSSPLAQMLASMRRDPRLQHGSGGAVSSDEDDPMTIDTFEIRFPSDDEGPKGPTGGSIFDDPMMRKEIEKMGLAPWEDEPEDDDNVDEAEDRVDDIVDFLLQGKTVRLLDDTYRMIGNVIETRDSDGRIVQSISDFRNTVIDIAHNAYEVVEPMVEDSTMTKIEMEYRSSHCPGRNDVIDFGIDEDGNLVLMIDEDDDEDNLAYTSGMRLRNALQNDPRLRQVSAEGIGSIFSTIALYKFAQR